MEWSLEEVMRSLLSGVESVGFLLGTAAGAIFIVASLVVLRSSYMQEVILEYGWQATMSCFFVSAVSGQVVNRLNSPA